MKKDWKLQGQSLAEFALTLPILLLVIMGIFDLGRGIFIYSTINHAAREGARFGAVHHCDSTGIANAVLSHTYGLLDDLDSDNVDEVIGGMPERIVVTVTYEFRPITPLIGEILGDGVIDMQSQARQLIELPTVCP
jgi:hypothetical protein